MASRALTQTAFFVLVALTDEPRHGYGIVQEVDTLSGGRVQLRIGTLYGVLDRLAADELIELDREEAHQGRLRRYYRLTDAGESALSEEAERMADGARTAARRVAGRRGGATAAGAGNAPAGKQPPAAAPPPGAVRPGLAGGGA